MTEKQGEQIAFADLGGWSGKTSPVHSVPGVRKAKTSGSSSKKRHELSKAMPLFLDLRADGNTAGASWVTGGPLLGDYTTHSFGECPSEENVSRLSQILEDMAHPKYYLSAKACSGILRRAKQRGKELPEMLRMALEAQAARYPFKRERESRGGGKGILIQNERVGALSTLNNQSVLFARKRSDKYHEPEVASTETATQHKDTTGLVIEMTSTKNTVVENGIVPTLTARMGTGGNQVHAVAVSESGTELKLFEAHQHHTYREGEVINPLTAGQNGGVRGDTPLICYGISSYGSNAMKSGNPRSGIYETESSRALDLNGGNPACNQGGVAIVESQAKVTASFYPQMKAESQCYRDDDISNTLVNGTNPGFQNGIVSDVVRRLTPTECERLQGFPDGWTDIGAWTDTKGKVHKESSDSARYKALGNSIALPFWFWLLRRISAQYERPATLGSLFDGIGGFPLCWERCNGPGTARWASEIEEFPIAVTKYHFGEK